MLWTVRLTAGSSGLCHRDWQYTQQVTLQGVQRRDSLWTTWEVERRRLPLLLFLLIGCSSAAWLSRCHNCVHNLVVHLKGRPGDVNASDYTRKTLVDWYLTALPTWPLTQLLQCENPNALGGTSWTCDLVSVANAFMLTDGPCCHGRLGRAAVRCKEDLCWPAGQKWRPH